MILSNIMSTRIHRPLESAHKVSISELAQNTEINFDKINSMNIHTVEQCVRNTWNYEIIIESDMNYLTNDSFRIAFVDGSYLTAKIKK